MYRKVAVLGAVAMMAAMLVGCGDKGTDKPPTTPTMLTLSVSAVPPTGGEVAIDPELDKYDKGTPVSLIATPKAGFVFKHWSGDVSSADSSIVINMDSNVVVAANFAVVCSLTVTSSLEEGGEVSVSPNQKVFLSGDTVIVTATVKPGHKFMGWSGGSTSKNLKDTLVITKNETLTANFEPLAKYNLTVNINNEHGTVLLDPAKDVYTEGDTVSAKATAKDGYGFIRWGGASTDTLSTIKLTVNNNMELTALFGKLYSLTINTSPSDDAGEIIAFPKRDMYRDGDSVKLSVKSNSGFLFESWEGLSSADKGVASDSVVTVVIGSNRIVIASFIRVYSFSVTMEPEDAGTLDFDLYPLKSYYVVGDTIKVIANSKSGYQFVGWEGAPAGAVVVGRIFNYVYGGTNRDNIELIAKFEPVESAPKRDGDVGYGDHLFLPYKKVTRGSSDSRF